MTSQSGGTYGCSYANPTNNPHDWTKPSIFRSVIYLERDPFLGVSLKVNERSENHRFGLDVRVGGNQFLVAVRRDIGVVPTGILTDSW